MKVILPLLMLSALLVPAGAREAVVYRQPVRGVVVESDMGAQVQQELARRRYYRGPIDGQVGPQTRAAIRVYQVDKGLPVTGRIDGALLKSLRLIR